jgi:serine/threonine protein kinase
MAEIFVASDPEAALADQLLVVKRIRSDVSSDQNFVKMFLDEARVFQRLSHPNIVRMHDFGEVAGRYFLALEYVWGESLAVLLHLCELMPARFPVGAALYIGAETAKALHHAHTLRDSSGAPWPVIHRDVTLGNVVISYRGDVKLLDFGIAMAKERLARTEAGNVKGTLVYLAPEQIYQEEVGPYTDVYQLGVLLYKTLVGREPVESQSEAGIVTAIARGQITPPSKVLPGFPSRVEQIILKAMALSPADRYPTAEALRQDISALLGSHVELGKQRLASLIASISRNRLQQQMTFINDLLQGTRATDEQSDLLRWVANTREPREVSVELSDQREVGAFTDQPTVTDEIEAPPMVPEIKVAPGPFLTIDPRVQAALAQAFRQPRDELEAESDRDDGLETVPGIVPAFDPEYQTDVADMKFPDVQELLGDELPSTVSRRAVDTVPTIERSLFEAEQTVETPMIPQSSEESFAPPTKPLVPLPATTSGPRSTPLVDGFPTEGPTKPMDDDEEGFEDPPTLRLPKEEIPED